MFGRFGFWGVFCLVSLCRPPGVLADVPSTQPADPKDRFKTFMVDLSHGNSADLADLCVATRKDSLSMLHDFQAVASAIKSLRAAVEKKFGPGFVDSVLPQLPSADDLDDMTESINGDRAELRGESIYPVQMVRSQQRWKIDLDWLAQSPDMPANPHWYGDMAQAIRRTAEDISGGRLDSPQAAIEALRARQDGIPDGPAATEPTTHP
ncbi:MAG TPA: hypothetical protein VHX86_15845 [Tepidisphaeraceae bacterium]|nr:hypothetical protein [Tepidisphaeraceae bacterium]